jgi:hypothetical protein
LLSMPVTRAAVGMRGTRPVSIYVNTNGIDSTSAAISSNAPIPP